MQSSKEKIEAQLCAYIDGELDDAERAEIEKHLDANPQHKALISELRAASGLLKDLPRAKVPGDLNEGLTGQLERSVLLNPSDEESGDAALRIRRWPQFTAVAAVLLLATGLAFVVYYALPGSQNNHGNQVALDNKSLQPASPQTHILAEGEIRLRTATTAETRGRAPDGTSDRFADAEGRKESMDRASAAKPTDSTTPLGESSETLIGRGYKAKGALEDGVAIDSLALNSTKAGQPGSAVATAKEVEELQQRVRKLSGEADGDFNLKSGSSLYLVVSTKDAAVAGKQINAFFKDNGIPHMTQDLGAVALQSNLDAGARSEGLNFKYKDANEATPGNETARLKSIQAEKTDAPAQNPAAAGGARGEDKDQLKQLTKLQTADSDPARKPAVEAETPPAPEKKNVESKVAQGAEPDQKREGTDTTRNPQPGALVRLQTEKLRPEAAAGATEPVLRKQAQPQDGGGLVGGRRGAIDETKDAVSGKQVGGGGGAGGAGGFGGPTYWNMRRAGETPDALAAATAADDVLSRGTMIVARMNRRQAIALSTTLSQQDGQTAQLKQVAPQQAAQGSSTLGRQDAVDPSKAEFGRQFGVADPNAVASGPAASQPIPPRDVRAKLAVRDSTAQEPAAADKAPGSRSEERSATLGAGLSKGGVAPTPTTRPTEVSRETKGIANGAFNLNVPAAPAPIAADAKTPAATAAVAAADPMEDPVDVYIVVKDQAPAAAATPPPNSAPAFNAPARTTESESKQGK